MDEVGGALVGIALVLSAVFIPAGFLAGITGSLYRQFALTIAFSVIISAFNALTLSPALGALLLKPKSTGASPRTARPRLWSLQRRLRARAEWLCSCLRIAYSQNLAGDRHPAGIYRSRRRSRQDSSAIVSAR